jgi:eukaryotic-like serine/threonine-protein kinase
METGHIVNQYVFIEKLGDGGMGEVWRGRHSYLDYDVAIKFLKPQFAHDRDLQERFLNEGKRQASLDHPNIVRAIDFATEAGRNYLIMKFVEGQGLDGRIEEAGGPLPVDEALDVSYQVLSALGHAHRAGVVHRDVKPSNILIDRGGTCYLTDFGIALAAGQARATRTGTVIGTTHYMSPEQIRRPHAVDGRTDVYSFGVVLFEMLTGRPPFDAEGDNEFLIKQAHVQEEPPKPSKLNHAVSKPIESVILCALAKQPDDRWSTCEEMAEALSLAAMGKRPVPRRTQPARSPWNWNRSPLPQKVGLPATEVV